MDPGFRRDTFQVYMRTEVETETGGTSVTREYLGEFYGALVFITKTFSFSGFEAASIKAGVPMPVVRIIFDIPFEFDYRFVEFEINGKVYVPRDPGLMAGGTGTNKIAYNCIEQGPRSHRIE